MKHWMIACLVLLGLPACSSGGDVNLGEDNPVALGEKLTDYSGRWQGYAEAYEFLSGSDRVLLRINDDGQGYAMFGEGTAPAPATNPDIAYPEGLTLMELVTTVLGHFLGGVRYPLHDVIVEQRRIRFRVSSNDLWDDWCGLQEPVLLSDQGDPEPRYGILPYNGYVGDGLQCLGTNGNSSTLIPADCGKLTLHSSDVCACTVSACRANSQLNSMKFDAALQSRGDELVGTLESGVTVRLTRE